MKFLFTEQKIKKGVVMTSVLKSVMKELQKFGVISENAIVKQDNKIQYISSQLLVVSFDPKDKRLDISFNIMLRPDLSARIITLLQKVEGVEDINVIENYFLKDNQIFVGDMAVAEYKNTVEERIIEDYVKKEMEKFVLKTSQGYNC